MDKLFILITILFILTGCKRDETNYDASGTFEATETIISAQHNGIIKAFNIREGQQLESGQIIGYIDTIPLHLKKEQVLAQITAILGKKPDASAQTAALKAQLNKAEREQKRLFHLLKSNAATAKQLDDANAEITILKKQIAAQKSALYITASSLHKETLPLSIQLKEIDNQLEKCIIKNPVTGTVLTKYAEAHELAEKGKPLYSIANLSTLILRAYITGDQFSSIKLGQEATVFVDSKNGNSNAYKGNIEWISNEAEFTPKTIQTKEERANLVYAIKVRVKNDGLLKIGMYGEIKLKIEN